MAQDHDGGDGDGRLFEKLPHSIFLPVEADYRNSRVDWLSKGILMPNAVAVPFGFGRRLRPMNEDNYRTLDRVSSKEESSSFESTVRRYRCNRCERPADPDNSVYTHPDQQGTDLCVACVRQRMAKEAEEPRQVFSVSFERRHNTKTVL